MMWTLQCGALWLLLLLTNGEASEKRLHRKTLFRQTPVQGGTVNRTQQTLHSQTEAVGGSESLVTGDMRTPHLGRSRESVMVNQSRRAGPNRRLMLNRRVLPSRTSANQGSSPQDTGNRPVLQSRNSTNQGSSPQDTGNRPVLQSRTSTNQGSSPQDTGNRPVLPSRTLTNQGSSPQDTGNRPVLPSRTSTNQGSLPQDTGNRPVLPSRTSTNQGSSPQDTGNRPVLPSRPSTNQGSSPQDTENRPVLPSRTSTSQGASPQDTENRPVLPSRTSTNQGSSPQDTRNRPVLPSRTSTSQGASPQDTENRPVLPSRISTNQGSSPQDTGNRPVLPSRTSTNQGSSAQDTRNKPDSSRAQAGLTRTALGSVSSLNILAGFAGKNRILIISAPHQSEGYYRLMMSLLKSDVYCEMAERHMHQIVMFHQEGEAGGMVRRVSNQGQITEEPLDPVLVPRLMNFLKLEQGKFTMVLLRKNLQVEERYPYPVRLEAMYEVMDQTPMRKLEKARQRGFVQRCKAAGVEGQVVESQHTATTGSDGPGRTPIKAKLVEKKPTEVPALEPTQAVVVRSTLTPRPTTTTKRPTTTRRSMSTTTTSQTTTTTTQRTTTTKPTTTKKPVRTTTTTTTIMTTMKPTTTTTPTTTTPTTTTTTTTTTRKPTTTTTTRKPTTTTRRTTTTTKLTTTIIPTTTAPTTFKPTHTPWNKEPLGRQKERHQHTTDNKYSRDVVTSPTLLTDDSLDEVDEELESDLNHEDSNKPIDSEAVTESTSSKRAKVKNDNIESRRRPGKPIRKNKFDKKRVKTTKDGNMNPSGRKSGKKGLLYQEKHNGAGPVKQANPDNPLTSFFGYFERRRRLLVITTPSEDNRMYTQQRDEYLENVCEMAIRKVSIITIFGSWTNGTMKIDHYQLEHDQPLKGIPPEDLTNQPLIRALRKELGMTFNDYYMVLTDFDMKVKQEYEVPIAMKAVTDYIDTFPSRITEMEHQKRHGLTCKKEDKSRSLENFLSRFRWRRRLFVISAPDDEEWAYQQQLYGLTSQACNLGLRHMSVLKLVGKDKEYMGGILELYPINGSATVEREDLTASLVRDIRNYFQISPEYFSMLLVGKDGNVKSWYPSPVWSMSIIYDLVDSMQLRRQEMAIQQSLGMRCPDDDYGHGYHDQDPDGYHHRGYGY